MKAKVIDEKGLQMIVNWVPWFYVGASVVGSGAVALVFMGLFI